MQEAFSTVPKDKHMFLPKVMSRKKRDHPDADRHGAEPMHFTKMHGAGNDFIIINNIDGAIPESVAGAAAGCAPSMSPSARTG